MVFHMAEPASASIFGSVFLSNFFPILSIALTSNEEPSGSAVFLAPSTKIAISKGYSGMRRFPILPQLEVPVFLQHYLQQAD